MRYQKKVKLLIVLSILLLVAIIAVICLSMSTDAEPAVTEPSKVDTMPQTAPPVTTEAVLAETSEAPTEIPTVAPTEAPTAPPTEAPTEAPTETPTEVPTDPPASKPSSGNQGNGSNTTKPTSPTKPKETEPPALKFPYSIPGTDLVITMINSYNGIFLEDGTDAEVSGISVIVVENRGKTPVEYANITLDQSGRELQFKATAIPAGASIVVQEVSAESYSSADYLSCIADVALLESFEMSSSLVKVEEGEDGSLTVTNLGDETIPCVRIFYKFCMDKEGKIYVGGITYNAKITDLQPGVPQVVAPSHYAAGASEIMMVRTYATAD